MVRSGTRLFSVHSPHRWCCGAMQKSVQAYGAFVDFGGEKHGLVHVSQLSVSCWMLLHCSCIALHEF